MKVCAFCMHASNSCRYQALKLADQVHEMKGMLAKELSTGIPEPVATTSSGTTSRYQEMLAKARADKAAGK